MDSHQTIENEKDDVNRSSVMFWRVPQLGNLELLYGSYAAQSFPRHTHDEYVLGVMVRGVEALNHRGSTQVAPAGSALMINPGEWHANYAPDDAGFAYRTLYPSVDLLKRFASEIAGKDEGAPALKLPAVVEDKTLSHLLLKLHLTLEREASSLEQ